MPGNTVKTLDVRTRSEWRRWLSAHHASEPAIWLVFHKRHTGVECLAYEESVEEALCFGWIDSLIKRLDDARYARKFTPRNADSIWSEINRKRYDRLRERGLLTPAGIDRAPTRRRYRPPVTTVPAGIRVALEENPLVWERFNAMPPSRKKACVSWIESAKREVTRTKRLGELIELLASGGRLGMK